MRQSRDWVEIKAKKPIHPIEFGDEEDSRDIDGEHLPDLDGRRSE